jgi:hypothetical protein
MAILNNHVAQLGVYTGLSFSPAPSVIFVPTVLRSRSCLSILSRMSLMLVETALMVKSGYCDWRRRAGGVLLVDSSPNRD